MSNLTRNNKCIIENWFCAPYDVTKEWREAKGCAGQWICRSAARSGIRLRVAELNQSQKPVLRTEDHPGDREVRDIVSIFAMTRSARARTKKGRRKRKEKKGGRKKIDSQPTSPMPSGILRFSAAWKSHHHAKFPPLTREKAAKNTAGRKREKEKRERKEEKKTDVRR